MFDFGETSYGISGNLLKLLEALTICGIPRGREFLRNFLNTQIQLLVPIRLLGSRMATLRRNMKSEPPQLRFEPLEDHC